MTPEYTNSDNSNSVTGKAVKFNVKVYKGTIGVKLSAKGSLNLLDRGGEYTLKNSIMYTPSFSNLKDQVVEARVFDYDVVPNINDDDSKYFSAEVIDGKIYVAPKVGVSIENNKNYPVRIWVKLANYGGNASLAGGMWASNKLNIRTAQSIPKVTASRTSMVLRWAV